MQTTRSAPEKQAEYDKMANAPVGGLILSLAVPTMVTTLIMSVYNMIPFLWGASAPAPRRQWAWCSRW